MPAHDLRTPPIFVYRILADDGTAAGYALIPPKDRRFRRIKTLDRHKDYVCQLQVHVFRTKDAADAFRAGLLAAGDDSANSLIQSLPHPHGWGVLREIHQPPDDPHDPLIAIVTHSAPDVL